MKKEVNLFHHELLDRLYVVTDIYDSYITAHDSNDILSEKEKECMTSLLWDQYQLVGSRIDLTKEEIKLDQEDYKICLLAEHNHYETDSLWAIKMSVWKEYEKFLEASKMPNYVKEDIKATLKEISPLELKILSKYTYHPVNIGKFPDWENFIRWKLDEPIQTYTWNDYSTCEDQ